MKHFPVMLNEILSFIPQNMSQGCVADLTAGGGGHFFAVLEKEKTWKGFCLDQDPLAAERIRVGAQQKGLSKRVTFILQNFAVPPAILPEELSFVIADLGISSFQIDDPQRGMSFLSDSKPDFRMDPSQPFDFFDWIQKQSETYIAQILRDYGEEPKAKSLAKQIKTWPRTSFESAKILADKIAESLRYPSPSLRHPATRAFQAFRMALNSELEVLDKMLNWAPWRLQVGGRMAVLSFHSLEDRIVKNRFRDLEANGPFDILTKKALVPGSEELKLNSRSRSAKLRVIERVG